MNAIIDSSSLIFLSKLNKLALLFQLFEEVFTTKEVYEEILEGLEHGHQDALEIKKFVEENKLKFIQAAKKQKFENLGKGERSILEAAYENNLETIIIDDLTAIKIAKYLNLKVMSIPFLLLLALKRKLLSKQEFIDLFNKLISEFDYRLSNPLYTQILDLAEKF